MISQAGCVCVCLCAALVLLGVVDRDNVALRLGLMTEAQSNCWEEGERKARADSAGCSWARKCLHPLTEQLEGDL